MENVVNLVTAVNFRSLVYHQEREDEDLTAVYKAN